MRAVAAAAVLVGCAPRAAEPLPAVRPQPRPEVRLRIENEIRVPRPDLPEIAALIPDLTEQLRWPLTIMEHPALEPRYPIASQLAVAGISWTELCARGVQHRSDPSHKDELAYLSAWCAAEQHDTAAAVRALAPLEHSSNLGIASAVPLDLVDMLVADVDFGHADRLLADENLRDARVWDLLAAAYFEVGKDADSAEASSTALQLDATPRADVRCHRLARLAMLGTAGQRPAYLTELADATKTKVPDPTCIELALSVPCVLAPAERCEPYLKKQHFVPWRAQILGIYERWPQHGGWSNWLDYAWKARSAWPGDGALELVNGALDAAVGAANCEEKAMEDISRGAYALAGGITALQAKANWVQTMTVDQSACEAFHDQWLASHR